MPKLKDARTAAKKSLTRSERSATANTGRGSTTCDITPPVRERDVEDYLCRRVKAMGGEVRKVKWIGRNSAPDRRVMLVPEAGPWPWPNSCLWVELKRPGGKATFPKDAHERAQHREHERMRRFGERVEVIDSFEGVDALLS